jgi:hypothetical protein
MSDTRRAHAPIEYAVMSASGAGQDAPWAKVRFGSKADARELPGRVCS